MFSVFEMVTTAKLSPMHGKDSVEMLRFTKYLSGHWTYNCLFLYRWKP